MPFGSAIMKSSDVPRRVCPGIGPRGCRRAYNPDRAYEFGLERVLVGLGALINQAGR
jgi:hypothetical protein